MAETPEVEEEIQPEPKPDVEPKVVTRDAPTLLEIKQPRQLYIKTKPFTHLTTDVD